jgi:hypothetical protein
MSTPGTPRSFLVAVASLAAATVFTGYELLQYQQLTRALVRQRMVIVTPPPQPPAPAVAAPKPAVVLRESTPRTARLDELIKKAPKVMGGIPLIFPEQIFGDYPELEQAFLDARNGANRLKYGPFFALAKLNEDEIENFCQIVADSETKWAERNKIATEKGLPPSDPSLKEMERAASEEKKIRLATLLGEERSAKLAAYQKDDVAETLGSLKNLIAATYHSANPVTPQQVSALSAITSELHVFSYEEAAKNPGVFDQAAQRASQVLAPGQLEVFQLVLDQQHVNVLRYLENRANRTAR